MGEYRNQIQLIAKGDLRPRYKFADLAKGRASDFIEVEAADMVALKRKCVAAEAKYGCAFILERWGSNGARIRREPRQQA